MNNQKLTATAFLLLLGGAAAASAQSTPSATKGYVSVNSGYQTTVNNFGDTESFATNAEEGRFDSQYTVKAGRSFDVAAGVLGWRHFGFGVGVSSLSIATPLHLAAEIPHPFFFNRGRAISGEVGGLKRQELAIHTQLRAMTSVGTRLQLMAFGGYSLFQLTQDVVTDVSYTDEYPYDSATFKGVTTTAKGASKFGINGGGDVAFFFTRQLGVGFGAQFARATVALPMTSGPVNVKVGGVQAGAGLRLRF